MNYDQKRKLLAGFVSAFLFILMLLAVIILYQIVTINVTKKKIAEAKETMDNLQKQVQAAEKDLEYYMSEYYLEQAARAYGYIYPEDKNG